MSDDGANSPAESAQPETGIRAGCPQCAEVVDAGDNYCRWCGAMTEHGAALVRIGKLSPPVPWAISEKPPHWAEGRVVVLLALLLVGPLALGMLWRSRRFTRAWKIGLTLAVLLVTVAAVWYTVEVSKKAIQQVLDLELPRPGLALTRIIGRGSIVLPLG